MELLGVWKLWEMVSADENGFKMISASDIEAMEDNEDNKEFKQLLRSDFIISENLLAVYYMPLDSELELAKEEGLEITDKGVLVDSFPAKIENSQLFLNYERDGVDYFPVELDDEGCLAISGGILKIKKA